MFCWKKFHVLVIYVHFVFQKLGPRENLKNFQCFAGLFFLLLFFDCLVCFFFILLKKIFFVFVPRGKSSVSSLGCFCCCCFFLNFLLGCLLYSGCSFTCSGFTNVGFKRVLGRQTLRARLCCRKISDSIFWLYYFTPRWLAGAMPCQRKSKRNIQKEKIKTDKRRKHFFHTFLYLLGEWTNQRYVPRHSVVPKNTR